MADITEDSMYYFLQKYGDSWVKRELLLFWIMHPNTRFDRKAIGYNLTSNNLDVEGPLRVMVEEGLVEKNISNGVTLYSLTSDEEQRQQIMKLANLGWYRWQPMLARYKNISSLAVNNSSKVQIAGAAS